MLRQDQFTEAMVIITQHHSNKVEINRNKTSTVDTSGNIRLEIIDCVPSVVHKLRDEGFRLSMKEGRLDVSK